MDNLPDRQHTGEVSDFLSGGGEMGSRMRAFDWSASPLGPARRWPQSLKTAVRIMLTSRQPMFVWWGEELINLYNDAYKAIVGGKHPEALGQPASHVWREIWDQVAPRAESAMSKNEGTYDESLLLIMERYGYPEETYYTFSYSPVPNDQGGTGGIICANTDDTQRIIGERQLALLRELAASTADARTFDDACALSASCLQTNPYDLPFAMIYLIDAEQQNVEVAETSGIARGHRAVPEVASLANDSLWPFAEVVRTHEIALVSNLQSAFDSLPAGAWERPPHQAAIVPIAPAGQTGKAGILVAGLNPFRLFDDRYRGFIELVAAQIAASIANAQAYEEERRRAEALAELDRAKTLFFSNISHEFRTPLTLMLGPLEDILAGDDGRLPHEDRERAEVAHRNSMRLLKLVNTLLDFSRIEVGRVQASYEPVDLSALTADLASVFRSAIERAGMRLVIDCPPLPEPVYIDRAMWEKIVLNLLSNAFKFTFEGQIEVRLRATGDAAELSVRDTGIGIPAEEIAHLFERFHRVQGARGRTYEGTGIGLALVQELTKLHGGAVRVESVYGQGSAFILTIPFGPAHLPADRIEAERPPASMAPGANAYVEEALRWLPEPGVWGREPEWGPGAGGQEPGKDCRLAESSSDDATSTVSCPTPGPRPPAQARLPGPRPLVLLADDNADMRDYVRRLLRASYEVEAVADGEQALAAAREHVPNLILTDIMMPRLDGFGLLRALRQDPRTATIPVILLSARAGEEARVEGIEAGADDYLVKPFAAREMLARVRTHLELARIRREAQEKIINIWESITEGFIAFDSEYRYIYINAEAERLGVKRDAVLGKTIWEAFPDLVGTQIEAEYHRAVQEQVMIGFENFYEPWKTWFEHRLFPVADGGLSVYFRDITERKQVEAERERLLSNEQAARREAEQAQTFSAELLLREQQARAQAEAANRMKDEFLATLSHELRTPLNAVLGWTAMLRMGKVGEEMAPHALEIIERNARLQAQLIEDLLDVSRIITGKLRLTVQPVELWSVIKAAADIVRPAADAKGIRLELLLDAHAGPVSGDPQRLQQVVWNLLANAVKFTPKEGRVQIRLERVNSHVEIIVSDTGEGISDEFLPHVFDRFRQADSTYTRRHGGLGLGLAIVRHLTELHGGTVTAQSNGAGQGATFTVKLPIIIAQDTGRFKVDATERATAAAIPALGESLRLDNLRLLLIEDEPDGRELAKLMLEQCGATVTVASSAAEGLRTLEQQSPDVLISDIEMQDEDGYTLIRKVRAMAASRGDIPAIALTAHARAEDRLRALAAGYDAHVAKPVEVVELTTVIASVVRRRKGA
jgi:PAS domain S-box-containing protein